MKKTAVVYWSGTGNTAAMADAVAAGMKEAGADVSVLECSEAAATDLTAFDAIAFGCPAMGDESLEDGDFEPLFSDVKKKVASKAVALFGSYGWGDGEWMRNWEADCRAAGIKLACESVICCGEPDGDAVEACKALGKALA
ncbi:MAG: flavodoxin [Oscillospiraceae bacterium]|nr:flavodoxin [Oscillospiraceae bacterium]